MEVKKGPQNPIMGFRALGDQVIYIHNNLKLPLKSKLTHAPQSDRNTKLAFIYSYQDSDNNCIFKLKPSLYFLISNFQWLELQRVIIQIVHNYLTSITEKSLARFILEKLLLPVYFGVNISSRKVTLQYYLVGPWRPKK